MSADLLRQAATILRERAEAATPGAWKLWGMSVMADQDGTSNVDTAVDVARTLYRDEHGKPRTFDASYIQTVQPRLGLAIAKWLEDVAAGWMWDADPDDIQTPDGWPLTLDESMDSHALTVALLIVGGSHD